ncbi:MAG: tRNA lysidine(34) synthetase TilS [Stellaceae bacterium]
MLSSETSPPPLGLAEFAARLDRLAVFETKPFVAVAVSGGPDSLALAILADRWARRRGGEICALSVDHRLRAESASELERLAGWLAARSIRHEILVWGGEKPRSRIQEVARAARYRLLAEWCRARGCLHLLTGHQRDDQIETYLLRREAGSGPAGLAAMSAIREIEGCRVLRPLLEVPKGRLLATLAAEGQPFVADPSNRNPVFARTRLRRRASPADRDWADRDWADRDWADRDWIAGEVARLGRERVARERQGDALVAGAVSLHPAGFAALDRRALLAAAPDLAERVLSALLFALGGARYPPRRIAVTRMLRVLGGDARGGCTLGGCRFIEWRGRILVLRELAAAAPPVAVEPGGVVFWDRRFEAASPAGGPALTLGCLGPAGGVELRRQSAASPPAALPRLTHPILPAFWDEKGLLAVPALGYRRDGGISLPRLSFKPVNSLSHASFAVV